MSKLKRIRALVGFKTAPDADIVVRANSVWTGMTDNPAYPIPPVDLAVFKAAIDSYSAAIAEALDGGKKAITERNTQREAVSKMLWQLGHYVEVHCKDDLAIFTSSGFEAASTMRVPPQPLTQPGIQKIGHGTTGELVVKITPVPKVRIYELRYAALEDGSTPGPWTAVVLTNAKAAAVNSLTPGTTYAFQVRAFGTLGYTGWSDSATLMCT